MQQRSSSAALIFRALIMLGFLAAIPFVAMSGNSLPDSMREKVEKFLPKSLLNGGSLNKIVSELFGGKSSEKKTAEAPLTAAPSLVETPAAASQQEAGPNAEPAGIPASISAAPRNFASDGREIPLRANPETASPVTPVGYQSPINSATATPNLSAAASDSEANPFLSMQKRLKDMGATYYLLETWGNQEQLYRFYCKMSVGGSANYTHCFEATHADPLQAMRDVVRQVEQWKNRETPGT